MQPPARRPRAGTLPYDVEPTTPSRKAPTAMPPPVAPITPRVRKTPAAKGRMKKWDFLFENSILVTYKWEKRKDVICDNFFIPVN